MTSVLESSVVVMVVAPVVVLEGKAEAGSRVTE